MADEQLDATHSLEFGEGELNRVNPTSSGRGVKRRERKDEMI